MHCPTCGTGMKEVERDTKIEEPKDWGDQKAVDEYCKKSKQVDEAIWWACPKKCFGDSYPLVMHHAPGFKNDEGRFLMKTPPGDSWSLTWLK